MTRNALTILLLAALLAAAAPSVTHAQSVVPQADVRALKPGEFLLSTDLSMRFLNAAPIGCGRLIAEGRAVYADPRKVVAEVTVSTPDGLTIAHGSAAIAIRVRRQDG